MLEKITLLSRNKIYWAILLLTCLLMEGVALYYQYALDYGPCVLCIHVRIWIAAIGIVALAALLLPTCPRVQKITHPLSLLAVIGLTERSWQTLAVERGWSEGSCSNLDTGLPDWFALDRWLPTIFEPWEPCGYTPELLFRITMAEGLLAFSVLMIAISLIFSLVQFKR